MCSCVYIYMCVQLSVMSNTWWNSTHSLSWWPLGYFNWWLNHNKTKWHSLRFRSICKFENILNTLLQWCFNYILLINRSNVWLINWLIIIYHIIKIHIYVFFIKIFFYRVYVLLNFNFNYLNIIKKNIASSIIVNNYSYIICLF